MRRTLTALLWLLPLAGLAGCTGSGRSEFDGGGDQIPCDNRQDCPALLGCADGFCGHCTRDRDCLVTEFCQPVERLCYPLFVGECTLNQDCDLGYFCVQGTCTPGSEVVPCVDESDCSPTERCDSLNLVCVEDYGCDKDADCAAGEVCNLANNRCDSACTPATQDVICGFGQVCDEFGRCVECYDDSQCGVGLSCNIETNRCEGENSCLTDRDCTPGTVCNDQTHQCTTTPPDCLSNADCPAGTLCDPPSGRCVSETCHADPYEPNDDPENAATIGPGRFSDLTLCPEDKDFFQLDLVRGDRLQIIVNTDFLASDHFQVVLFDPSASEVLREGSLLIDHVVAADGRYPIRVQTTDPLAEYALLVTVSRGIPCDDDPREPDDSAYQARAVAAGHYGGLVICPNDEDWFVLERPLDLDLQVRIEFPSLQGDLDLDLLAGDGQTLVMRSASAGDAEFVHVENAAGTRFFIRVYADAAVDNAYEMQVDLLPRRSPEDR